MMKTKYTFAVLAFCFSCAVMAQSTKFGIKIEPQSTWFTVIGDHSGTSNNGVGLNFGLMIDKYFADNYAVELGASLSTVKSGLEFDNETTWKLNGTNKDIPAKEDINLNIQYIDIPVGLKFLSKEMGYVKIYANMGGNLMFRIRALADVESIDAENNNAKDEVSVLNFGYHIGGGVQYSLGGSTSILAGVNYTNGFLDITSEQLDDVTVGIFGFRVGLIF